MKPVDRASTLPLTWRKSSYSNQGSECVELATTPQWTAFRDSKNPHGGTIVIAADQWASFRLAVTAN
ncbi:uncharacterized protein DUF397 [Herbihabitans rhizosphaerae]|uniref:Uncharacterized protein DUF397 n=1 Tax=Herbihabitans rhizosphaerae TaxID=1872711 RepID=A0A4Q7L7X0_9PSEU|nr:DUF397 domain-containing protein [Herbihabitans rhizosphaerae]RZS44472.1 uncharacterized protein DUF397 [Herbihabitans rhizosphaerae]